METRKSMFIMGTQLMLLLDLWKFLFNVDKPGFQNPRAFDVEKVTAVIERGDFQLLVSDHHSVVSYCLIEEVFHVFIEDNMSLFHNLRLNIASTFAFLQRQLSWTPETAATWERFICAIASSEIIEDDLC